MTRISSHTLRTSFGHPLCEKMRGGNRVNINFDHDPSRAPTQGASAPVSTFSLGSTGAIVGAVMFILAMMSVQAAELNDSERAAFAQYDFVVVRVDFDDEATGARLAATFEPMETHYEQGYLLLQIDRDEFSRLRDDAARLGIDVRVDYEKTQSVNTQTTPADGAGAIDDAPGHNGRVDTIPGFACYKTVEGTYEWAANLASTNPNLAQWVPIGDSWDKINGFTGYEVRVLRLGNRRVGGTKPKVLMTGAIHAREYTTAELLVRLADQLIANYGVDADTTWILDEHEIHLVLIANPDGRKYAESGLLWRKNTNQAYCGARSSNRGVDLNRNFDFKWGCCDGSSTRQCSQTFRGRAPASEPEIATLQQYMRSLFPDRRGDNDDDPAPAGTPGLYLDIHSSGQLLLWPWGFTENGSPNDRALVTLGRKLSYFNGHRPIQGPGLYITDGTTTDYSYGALGVASFTYELGTRFFQSCSYFENTLLGDNLPSLTYALKIAREPYRLPAGPDTLPISFSEPMPFEQGATVRLTAQVDDTRFNNSEGAEPFQVITAAEFYIDTPPWRSGAIENAMTAADGSWDSAVEGVAGELHTDGLSPGRHRVFVRGRDAAGNYGPVTAAFFDVEERSDLAKLTIDDVRVAEGDQIARSLIRLTTNATNDVLVSVHTRSQTAVGGSDFYGFTRRVRIPAGQRSVPVDVVILDDGQRETTETFGLRLFDPDGAEIDDALATITILDDDVVERPQIDIAGVQVREDARTAIVTVSLSEPATEAVSFGVYSQAGTAMPRRDYYGFWLPLHIQPGQQTQRIPVTIVDDAVSETSESFTVRLVRVENADVGVDTATVTVVDDD